MEGPGEDAEGRQLEARSAVVWFIRILWPLCNDKEKPDRGQWQVSMGVMWGLVLSCLGCLPIGSWQLDLPGAKYTPGGPLTRSVLHPRFPPRIPLPTLKISLFTDTAATQTGVTSDPNCLCGAVW